MDKIKIAVIGGSGLYQVEGFDITDEIEVNTPFGKPSGKIMIGTLEGKKIAFLPRHGKGHILTPTEVNYRANIYALKSLGVEMIMSVSAVGSMKEEIKPGDFVVPDQLFDRTRSRPYTFFGEGVVVHIPFDKPYCPEMSKIVCEEGEKLNLIIHKGGTYICIEGPQFSTKAESKIFRSWGVDVIGMTNIPEAKLAREAEICYVTVAMSTDYDVWHEGEEVSVEKVLGTIKSNVANIKKLMKAVVKALPEDSDCKCRHVLQGSIQTAPEYINMETVKKLDVLLGKYFKK